MLSVKVYGYYGYLKFKYNLSYHKRKAGNDIVVGPKASGDKHLSDSKCINLLSGK